MQHRFCQISNLILAQKTEFWYADLHILIERGTLTHELSLLLRNDDTETNEEDQTGVYHLLLSGVSTRTFNERTDTSFKYLEVPTDSVRLVVLWRLRYKLSLRDLAEMFLERGFEFTYEAVRDWEARFAPLIADQLRTRAAGTSRDILVRR
jgi:hypothetical protein